MADGTVIGLLITTSLGIAVYLAKHVKKSECWSKERCIECDFRGSSQPNTPVINNEPTITSIIEIPKLNNETEI